MVLAFAFAPKYTKANCISEKLRLPFAMAHPIAEIDKTAINYPEPQFFEELLFEVIGYLLTNSLPDVFTEICTGMGGNPQLCEAGGKALSVLISLSEDGFETGSTKGVGWKVSKGRTESYVSFKCADEAQSHFLEKFLHTYAEECAKDLVWKKIMELDYNKVVHIDPIKNAPYRDFMVRNISNGPLSWYGSLDGSKWRPASAPIPQHFTGGLFDFDPFSPIRFTFDTERSIPYYFRDGAYIKFFNGREWVVQYFLWGKKYVFEQVNGLVVAHEG